MGVGEEQRARPDAQKIRRGRKVEEAHEQRREEHPGTVLLRREAVRGRLPVAGAPRLEDRRDLQAPQGRVRDRRHEGLSQDDGDPLGAVEHRSVQELEAPRGGISDEGRDPQVVQRLRRERCFFFFRRKLETKQNNNNNNNNNKKKKTTMLLFWFLFYYL